jgi:hypothetical protein
MMISMPGAERGPCGERLARLPRLRREDALELGRAARHAHALVKGPNVIALHGLSDEIYVNADAHAADLLEGQLRPHY